GQSGGERGRDAIRVERGHGAVPRVRHIHGKGFALPCAVGVVDGSDLSRRERAMNDLEFVDAPGHEREAVGLPQEQRAVNGWDGRGVGLIRADLHAIDVELERAAAARDGNVIPLMRVWNDRENADRRARLELDLQVEAVEEKAPAKSATRYLVRRDDVVGVDAHFESYPSRD